MATAAVVLWLANRSPKTAWLRPSVNHAQAQAMLPVIDAYLDRHVPGYDVGGLDPQLKPKDFCETHIIEIRPDGQRWRVGMVARCAEFARLGYS